MPVWSRRATSCTFWLTAGTFSEDDALRLEQALPLLMKQLEQKLLYGELNPRRQGQVTLHLNSLVCDTDTRGSCGYLYITL